MDRIWRNPQLTGFPLWNANARLRYEGNINMASAATSLTHRMRLDGPRDPEYTSGAFQRTAVGWKDFENDFRYYKVTGTRVKLIVQTINANETAQADVVMWASPVPYVGTPQTDHQLFRYPGCKHIFTSNVNAMQVKSMTAYYRRMQYVQAPYSDSAAYRGWVPVNQSPNAPLYLNIAARNSTNLIDVVSPTYKNIQLNMKVIMEFDIVFWFPKSVTPTSGNFGGAEDDIVEEDVQGDELEPDLLGGAPTPE